jgi:hypothetical protein
MNQENALLWLFPLVFTMLSLEEMIWSGRNSDKLKARLQGRMQFLLPVVDGTQGRVTALLKLVILTFFTFLATMENIYFFFLSVNTVFVFYCLLHLVRSAWAGGYTPGLASAALLGLPYSFHLFHYLTAEHLVTWKQIYSSIPAGFLLLPVMLIGRFFEEFEV